MATIKKFTEEQYRMKLEEYQAGTKPLFDMLVSLDALKIPVITLDEKGILKTFGYKYPPDVKSKIDEIQKHIDEIRKSVWENDKDLFSRSVCTC